MTRNPILDELRKTREELLADAGGTMAGLVAQLQEDERKSGRQLLDPGELRATRRADTIGESGRVVVVGQAVPDANDRET